MQDIITFQLPTHYLPRIALRLEFLYNTIQQACSEIHPIIHGYALQCLVEMLQLIQKPELKSRFLQELMRLEHAVNKNAETASPELHTRLYAQIQVLTHVVGRFGDGIQNIPFLQSMRQTQTSGVNDCEVQSPQLLLWLEAAPQLRQENLLSWLTSLKALHDTVFLYLSLLRNSAVFKSVKTVNGFYQCPLPPRTLCQLILLRMDKSLRIVPQMQIGHHGLSLRLYEAVNMKEVRENVADLELAICQF